MLFNNDPAFSSTEFKDYMKQNGSNHVITACIVSEFINKMDIANTFEDLECECKDIW